MQGTNLLPVMSGDEEKIRDYAYSCIGAYWSIRSEDWAYILPVGEEANRSDGPELYNRKNDLAEQHNVIAENRDVAAGLEKNLREWTGVSPSGQGQPSK